MPPGRDPSSKTPQRQSILVALPVGAVLLVFGQILGHGLVTWDDCEHVCEPPWQDCVGLELFREIWSQPYFGMYVPMSYTLFAAETGIADAMCVNGNRAAVRATVLHGGSLALHAACAAMVFLLLRRLVAHDGAACAGACFFALHPLQVETVAWVSETRGLLAAFFSLAAMLLYLHWERTRTRWASLPKRDHRLQWGCQLLWTGATGCFAAALLAKPSAVVVPLFLLVIDASLLGRSPGRSLRAVGPWFLLSAAAILWTSRLQPGGAGTEATDLLGRLIVASDALVFYAQKLAFPWWLVPDYGRTPRSITDGSFWPLAVVLAALAVAALVVCWPRYRAGSAAVCLFVVGVLPVLGLIPFDFQRISTVADRYVYLAMVGPAAGLALGLSRLWNRAVVAVVAVVLCVLANVSLIQASHWRNDRALWNHTLAIRPTSIVANHNRGYLLAQRGRFADAIPHYRRVIEVRPSHVSARLNLAVVLGALGRVEEAHVLIEEAQRMQPESHVVQLNLRAVALLEGRKPESTAGHFHRTARLRAAPARH